MTTNYIIEKGKRHSNIFDAATGEYLCQLRNSEVKGWILRSEQAREKDAWWAAREKEARIERIQTYLAKRASRLAAPKQIEMF
jgi:hypothetical protein